MNSHAAVANAPGGAAAEAKGLTYTKTGLFMLFGWLLWGDFCFTVMEAVVPSILPLKLEGMGAPNWLIGGLVTTIPGLLTTTVNPAASFMSDRLRSRWGRRIPFLFCATPFVTIFLIALGFSEEIGMQLKSMLAASGITLSSYTAVLAIMCLFITLFQFFHMFINSVYYYLFNDVVPHQYLARFMALFRIVGVLASSLYTWFVYSYANTHMREIFLIAALVYFVAFMLMCWRVKEGSYHAPPENVDGGHGVVSGVKTFLKECFTWKFYWFFFLTNSLWAMNWAMASFSVFYARSVGIDMATFGKIAAVSGIVGAILMYPAGSISDRKHPLRVMLFSVALLTLITPLSFVFLFFDFSPQISFAIYIATTALSIPIMALYSASELPMYMMVLPQSRYGQFCAANASVRSFFIMGSGVLAGTFLDCVKPYCSVPDFQYRFVPVWYFLFYLLSLVFLTLLWREWKARGGAGSYIPPGEEPDAAKPAPESEPAAPALTGRELAPEKA